MTADRLQSVNRRSDLTSYLINAMHYFANPIAQDRDHATTNQFLDIPLSGQYFINLIQAAYRISLAQHRERPVRFLDVGCGGGSKVMIAAHFFEQSDGLEYNADFVANAQRSLKAAQAEGCRIFQGDALTFEGYGSYDIIYFYRPISDPVLAAKMEARILDQARPGTIIIAPMPTQLPQNEAERVASVTWHIYLAHMNKAQAADIKKRAMQKGPDWQLSHPNDEATFGFWWPIIAASRSNGYCLPR